MKSLLSKIIVLILLSTYILINFSTIIFASENSNSNEIANSETVSNSENTFTLDFTNADLYSDLEINSESAVLFESNTRKCFI